MKIAKCSACKKVSLYYPIQPNEDISAKRTIAIAQRLGWWYGRRYWLCPKCNSYEYRQILQAMNERLDNEHNERLDKLRSGYYR